MHYIFGNNDGERAIHLSRAEAAENMTCYGDVMIQEFETKRIFMNHYSSKAIECAKLGNFDVCIGGHDHLYRVEKYRETLFINPGNTVTKDKWLPQDPDRESSFVILDLETMETERVMVQA